ncbi:hypothetical protein ACEPAI_287 [Sanghuangporus weigelae]
MLSPGVKFLLSCIPSLSAQMLCIWALCYGTSKHFGYEAALPLYLKVVVSLVLRVVFGYGRGVWSEIQRVRDVKARGAIRVPTVRGSWPGNVDTLRFTLETEKSGHLADDFLFHVRNHGWTYNWRLLWEDKIVTMEPEHIKAVLATEFDNFEKGGIVIRNLSVFLLTYFYFHSIGDQFKIYMQSVLGDGVFNSDGEMWKFHRSMTRPFFSKDRISHFELFGRHADEALALLKSRMREGHAVDIQDLVARFTLDSATEFLFSHCVHILRAGLPYSPNLASSGYAEDKSSNPATLFSRAFANAQLTVGLRTRLGDMWPLFEMAKDLTKEDMRIVNAFIDPILEEAVTKRGTPQEFTAKKEIGEGETLLDHLITYTKDLTILRDEILNIMIAGRDTTAATLTFATYCLAMYPNVMQRLREEILAIVGSERNPTYDDLKQMKYLRAFINETLRLYPPVPFDMRSSINATTFVNKTPGGKPFYVPPRTQIVYSVFLMHRRTDLWGPDAQEFDPDRFLDYRLHRYLTPNPFIFLPFNAGPRICLGQQFAYNEVSFMLVKLCQNFDRVELAPDAQPPETIPPPEWARNALPGERKAKERVWLKTHLTMHANGGLWVRLHEAPTDGSA